MKTLRLLVIDDHELVRIGVRAILESQNGWEICGEGANLKEAVRKSSTLQPDVVILDLGMPALTGLEAARQIISNNPGQRILIFSELDSEQVMQNALRAGVKAFILKSDPGPDLIAAVHALEQGSTFFTPRMDEIVLKGFLDHLEYAARKESPINALTPREREILQLLVEGKSTKQVACVLDLSVKTAETHRNRIMRKLNAHSLAQLVLQAIQKQIIYVSSSEELIGPESQIDEPIRRKQFRRKPVVQVSPAPTFCWYPAAT